MSFNISGASYSSTSSYNNLPSELVRMPLEKDKMPSEIELDLKDLYTLDNEVFRVDNYSEIKNTKDVQKKTTKYFRKIDEFEVRKDSKAIIECKKLGELEESGIGKYPFVMLECGKDRILQNSETGGHFVYNGKIASGGEGIIELWSKMNKSADAKDNYLAVKVYASKSSKTLKAILDKQTQLNILHKNKDCPHIEKPAHAVIQNEGKYIKGQIRVIMPLEDGNLISIMPNLSFYEKMVVIVQLVKGVVAAHAENKPLGDRKPENILWTRSEDGSIYFNHSDVGYGSKIRAKTTKYQNAADYKAREKINLNAAKKGDEVDSALCLKMRLADEIYSFGRTCLEVLLSEHGCKFFKAKETFIDSSDLLTRYEKIDTSEVDICELIEVLNTLPQHQSLNKLGFIKQETILIGMSDKNWEVRPDYQKLQKVFNDHFLKDLKAKLADFPATAR